MILDLYVCSDCHNPMSVNRRGPPGKRCMSCERERKNAATRKWRREHPERNKEVQRRAGAIYDKKRRNKHSERKN